jgi:hypothetical protein
MPKRITPLSDIQVKNVKPREIEYKLMDGYGLFLLVTPTNGKLWRLDYRINNKRKTIALGAYPAITLADARQRREDAKKRLANGIDPGEMKKALKSTDKELTANTFEPESVTQLPDPVGLAASRGCFVYQSSGT